MPITTISATPQELSAILTGLRMVQLQLCQGTAIAKDIDLVLTDDGSVDPINSSAIDALCEKINTSSQRFFIVEHISLPSEAGQSPEYHFWNNSGWDSLQNAASYDIEDILRLRLPMGADVRWVPADTLSEKQYRSLFETRADLMNIPAFVWLTTDSSGNPCVWSNNYSCNCDGEGTEWSDAWSCQCNDECVTCGSETSAKLSNWIGPDEQHWQDLWAALPEAE